MDKQDVQTKTSGSNGTFFISEDGNEQAIMNFRISNNTKMTIDHTEVYDGNEGKGYGKKLVAKAVAYARENNYKIVAYCSFAKSVIERNEDYKDILAS